MGGTLTPALADPLGVICEPIGFIVVVVVDVVELRLVTPAGFLPVGGVTIGLFKLFWDPPVYILFTPDTGVESPSPRLVKDVF